MIYHPIMYYTIIYYTRAADQPTMAYIATVCIICLHCDPSCIIPLHDVFDKFICITVFE